MSGRRVSLWIGGGVALVAAVIVVYLRSDAYCETDSNCRQLLQLEQVVLLYRLETGALPSDLKDLLNPQRDFDGPYLKRESMLFDKWGRPISYSRADNSSGEFRLIIRASGDRVGNTGPPADIVRQYP